MRLVSIVVVLILIYFAVSYYMKSTRNTLDAIRPSGSDTSSTYIDEARESVRKLNEVQQRIDKAARDALTE